LPTIVWLFFGSVYFTANMPTATAWLQLMCRPSKAWQKRSKNKR